MREYQVRICERLRVKFPGPTRQTEKSRDSQVIVSFAMGHQDMGSLRNADFPRLSPHRPTASEAPPPAQAPDDYLRVARGFSRCSASDGPRRRHLAMASRAWSSTSKKDAQPSLVQALELPPAFQRAFIGRTKIWPG